jgi:hypothetical protein
MKMCTPMLAGAPPPKFPGNQLIDDESRIHTWDIQMRYYSKYLIDLCVPWSDESGLLFEGENFRIPTHRPSNFLNAAPSKINPGCLAWSLSHLQLDFDFFLQERGFKPLPHAPPDC